MTGSIILANEPPMTAYCLNCKTRVVPVEVEHITTGWLGIPDGTDVHDACPICGEEVDFYEELSL